MIKPRQAVMEMQAYNPPTSNREGSLRLDFNENTSGCSKNVIKSLRKIKRGTLSTYPEYTALKKEVAKYCKVKSDEIIATNGTDEAIKTIIEVYIEVYIEKGKNEIIIPMPTYAMFKFYAQLNEAINIANEKSPEHLELQIKNPENTIRKLKNYGSLFIGENTAEVFGDYCSGTNHVLPTNGAARFTGGLSVKEFVKIVTCQRFSRKIPKSMIKTASKLAEIEGLDAHRKAALIRSKSKSEENSTS
ncbi:aminotransferase class I/II-fold pyridoxal phosphate-dependent enzyme [Candidatus Woesearchaeota archaeon]|nr:aminotransferase class I/II-fold pyridoxal phosphate-dependent enzyme [Candidatus Woesearchaeota archaeon]